uniref:WG repeat-containing protein n=1 Tax=Cetobacterium sp. TaxID=2071632 RepID=UPI0025BF270B
MKKISIIIILLIIGIGSMDTNMFKLNYNPEYKVGEFKKQVAKFIYLNKFGILSDDGEVIISPSFDDIKDIELRDRFFVNKNGKWGIINKFRKIIIDYEYEDIRGLDKNKYIVKKNGKWGIINKDNEIKIPIKYENIKT